MLSTLAVVVVFVLVLAWLVRASRRWSSSGNDGGWDPGYQPYVSSDGNGCSPGTDRDDSCSSDSDPGADSGGDCGSDGGGSD
ncbi:hypothetical protein HIV01_013230 [Lysobacter arenosi]|uniref:Secreted protein n=1 Tax=Lysobacter arenosi TaxID=2795387 RepID=A0ABX7R9S7_9GAMM|nr:hypothetical protein [Lysobacter arenosi]QSX74161.1 hypothetical protein HIV01_013230 [Lysobacter arenosi]